MTYVFRRPWIDWRHTLKRLPFVLPPTPVPPTPVTPSIIRDRRGVIVTTADPSELSDPNAGLSYKQAVRCATTANITLIGLQSIDGVTVTASDRVLVKNQTDAKQNGIYIPSSGIWQRTPDASDNKELAPGTQILVLSGTVNASKVFYLSVSVPVVIGTSDLPWVATSFPTSALEFNFDGGGITILSGDSNNLEVPFECQIARWTLLANAVGSMQCDVFVDSYAGFYAATSICGSTFPALSNERKAQGSAISDWSPILHEGDIVTAHVTSVSGISFATLSLLVSRS